MTLLPLLLQRLVPTIIAVLLLASSSVGAIKEEEEVEDADTARSNILLLVTDDQDVFLGSFDHMPAVRKLLQEQGMTFENGFVHTPVCCPSRSSILTGRYLHNCGAINNSISGNCYGEPWKTEMEPYHTYALHAQKAGYTTAFAGKYLNQYGYMKSKAVPAGWDHWLGLVGNSVYYNYTLIEGGTGKPTTVHKHSDNYEKDYLPDVMQNHSLRLLESLPEPWLLVLAWPSCHGPFTPAPWANGTMTHIHVPITDNYNASTDFMQQKHWLLRQLHPLSNDTAHKVERYYQMRLETLKTVDVHVESLVSKLESKEQLDRTTIMYTSDNGFQFGQHRLAIDKRHLYEHDIRVPFVIRGPKIPHNVTSSKIVANVDIAPTILDICNAPREVRETMDGISFWKYARRDQQREEDDDDASCPFEDRQDLLISYNGEGSAKCGTTDCPPPYDGIWWMPDAFNNTYHCVRTLQGVGQEDSIYCRFEDDESFVEFYDLTTNPQQLKNDYFDLEPLQRQRYEHRLEELLSCQGSSCRNCKRRKKAE